MFNSLQIVTCMHVLLAKYWIRLMHTLFIDVLWYVLITAVWLCTIHIRAYNVLFSALMRSWYVQCNRCSVDVGHLVCHWRLGICGMSI